MSNLDPTGPILFISHSSRDNEVTEQVFNELANSGIHAWLDFKNLSPGVDWRSGIDSALNNCHSGLLILSQNSIASPECRAEWTRILALNKMLYIALVDDTPMTAIPARLSILQIVPLTQGFSNGMVRLIQTIQADMPATHIATDRGGGEQGDSIAGLAQVTEALPQQPPQALIGRDGLMEEVHDLLDQRTSVLLQGFPGVGKTAVALTIAAQWLRQVKGDILWVRAGSNTASELITALVRRLDRNIAPSSEDELRRTLLDLLNQFQIRLIVLDDVWNGRALHVLESALPHDIALLVTSRIRFPLSGVIKELDILTEQDALGLLEHCATHSLHEDPDATSLCKALDYLPFAIEIAGNILKMRPTWSSHDLLAYWEGSLHNLEPAFDFSEAGSRNISALIEISLEFLGDAAKSVFMAFGLLFTPTATANLLALVLHGNDASSQKHREVERHLLELHDHGLIQMQRFAGLNGGGSIYYRTHGLAYDYARSQSSSNQQRVLAACVTYSDKHKSDVDMLEIERANLLRALETATVQNETQHSVDIAWNLLVESKLLTLYGLLTGQLHIFELAAASAEQNEEVERAHYLWSKIGNLYVDIAHNTEKALTAYGKALDLAQRLGDSQREAILLIVMGRLQFDDIETLIAHYQSIAAENTSDVVRALMFNHLGNLECLERNNYEQGFAYLSEQVRITEKLMSEQSNPDNYVQELHSAALQSLGTCEHDM